MSFQYKKIVSLLTVILVAIPLLAACGDVSQTEANVTLGVSTIDMPSTVKAGQVTFHVKNSDTSNAHDFVVFKTDLAPDKLPLDSSGNKVDETAQGLTKVDEVLNMAPDDTQDLTVALDPGKYVAISNLPGQYQAGMYTGFTVQ